MAWMDQDGFSCQFMSSGGRKLTSLKTHACPFLLFSPVNWWSLRPRGCPAVSPGVRHLLWLFKRISSSYSVSWWQSKSLPASAACHSFCISCSVGWCPAHIRHSVNVIWIKRSALFLARAAITKYWGVYTTEIYFRTILEAQSPTSGCQPGRVLVRAHFLMCRWQPSHHFLSQWRESISKLSGVSSSKDSTPIMGAHPQDLI